MSKNLFKKIINKKREIIITHIETTTKNGSQTSEKNTHDSDPRRLFLFFNNFNQNDPGGHVRPSHIGVRKGGAYPIKRKMRNAKSIKKLKNFLFILHFSLFLKNWTSQRPAKDFIRFPLRFWKVPSSSRSLSILYSITYHKFGIGRGGGVMVIIVQMFF